MPNDPLSGPYGVSTPLVAGDSHHGGFQGMDVRPGIQPGIVQGIVVNELDGRQSTPAVPDGRRPSTKGNNLSGLRDRVLVLRDTLCSKRHKWVIKSTSRENEAVRLEYVRRIIAETWESRECRWVLHKIQERPIVNDCVVAFKSLVVLHRVLQQGPVEVVRDCRAQHVVFDKLVAHWGFQAHIFKPSQQRHMAQAVADYAALLVSKMEFMTEPRLGLFKGNWTADSGLVEQLGALQVISGLLNFSEPLMQLALQLVAPSKDLKRLDRSVYMRLYISGVLALLDESWSLLCTVAHIVKNLLCFVHSQKQNDPFSQVPNRDARPPWLELALSLLTARPRFFWFHASMCDFVAHCHQLRCAGFPYIGPHIPKVPQSLLNLFGDLNDIVQTGQSSSQDARSLGAGWRGNQGFEKDGANRTLGWLSTASTAAGSGPISASTPRRSDGSSSPPDGDTAVTNAAYPQTPSCPLTTAWGPSLRVQDAFKTVEGLRRPLPLASSLNEQELSAGTRRAARSQSQELCRDDLDVGSSNQQLAADPKSRSWMHKECRSASPTRRLPSKDVASCDALSPSPEALETHQAPLHWAASRVPASSSTIHDGYVELEESDEETISSIQYPGAAQDASQRARCESHGVVDRAESGSPFADSNGISVPPLPARSISAPVAGASGSNPMAPDHQKRHPTPGYRRTSCYQALGEDAASEGEPGPEPEAWSESWPDTRDEAKARVEPWIGGSSQPIFEESGKRPVHPQDRTPPSWAEAICRSNANRSGQTQIPFLNNPPSRSTNHGATACSPRGAELTCGNQDMQLQRPTTNDGCIPLSHILGRSAFLPASSGDEDPYAKGTGFPPTSASPSSPRQESASRGFPTNPFDMNTLQIKRAALGLDPHSEDVAQAPAGARHPRSWPSQKGARGAKQADTIPFAGFDLFPQMAPETRSAPVPPPISRGVPAPVAGVQDRSPRRAEPRGSPQRDGNTAAASDRSAPLQEYDWEIDPSELSIEERIGVGATAEVFRASWHGTDVAVKRLLHRGSLPAEYQRELSVLLRLRHPNLVLFMGASTLGWPTIVSEFCAGGNVFTLLHQRPDVSLSWHSRLKIALDVAKGMNFLHRRQVVHRDLKSLNLLLASQTDMRNEDMPQVKISDFGLSRARHRDQSWDKVCMTSSAGTYHWMAPEVLDGSAYDEKVDVYSYSICLFEVICRRIPFEETGLEPISIAVAVSKGRRPDLSCVSQDCPSELRLVMECCWDHNPAGRPSFDSILDTLKVTKVQ